MPLNVALQERLQEPFKPLGIVAYSDCCTHCTAKYATDPDFEPRDDGGIKFFGLYLEGMNHHPEVTEVYASYNDFEYLMEHWDEECELIRLWARVVGVEVARIEKPESIRTAVGIFFSEPLGLESYTSDDDLEDDEDFVEEAAEQVGYDKRESDKPQTPDQESTW